jgi:hypothetical protein
MENETGNANACIAYKGDEKDLVMAVLKTVCDTLASQVNKGEICDSIDNLSRINGDVIVLRIASSVRILERCKYGCSPPHTS